VADRLRVKPEDCVVFEDAPKGVEAARNAGMESVAITTMHSRHEFDAYTNVLCFINDYSDPQLARLLR
jgi:beta-phosphoglucomutase